MGGLVDTSTLFSHHDGFFWVELLIIVFNSLRNLILRWLFINVAISIVDHANFIQLKYLRIRVLTFNHNSEVSTDWFTERVAGAELADLAGSLIASTADRKDSYAFWGGLIGCGALSALALSSIMFISTW